MLFVEGVQSSLDSELYTVLFENVSVISKEKCDLVEIAVKGLRNNSSAHWINAVGIIDNDNNEPYRVCRRVNILRDYPDDKIKIYP